MYKIYKKINFSIAFYLFNYTNIFYLTTEGSEEMRHRGLRDYLLTPYFLTLTSLLFFSTHFSLLISFSYLPIQSDLISSFATILLFVVSLYRIVSMFVHEREDVFVLVVFSFTIPGAEVVVLKFSLVAQEENNKNMIATR